MKPRKVLSLLLVLPITACSQESQPFESKLFYLDTSVVTRLYEGEESCLKDIEDIYKYYDTVSDNYRHRDTENVLSINDTPTQYSKDFYELIKTSVDVANEGAVFFNPLCGSLAKLWKESLLEKKLATNEQIQEELSKLSNTTLHLEDNYTIYKTGNAEIDLGGIVKGYALDKVHEYLKSKNVEKYLINAGFSSILLGKKNSDDGLFTVKINDLNNSYIKLKDCFLSTSSLSVQGVQIEEGGPTYSHIINPTTGSAINENDAVIVVSQKGYLGDALSTSMMMNTVEEIKAIEKSQNVQTIVVKNKQIIYKNDRLEIYHG